MPGGRGPMPAARCLKTRGSWRQDACISRRKKKSFFFLSHPCPTSCAVASKGKSDAMQYAIGSNGIESRTRQAFLSHPPRPRCIDCIFAMLSGCFAFGFGALLSDQHRYGCIVGRQEKKNFFFVLLSRCDPISCLLVMHRGRCNDATMGWPTSGSTAEPQAEPQAKHQAEKKKKFFFLLLHRMLAAHPKHRMRGF